MAGSTENPAKEHVAELHDGPIRLRSYQAEMVEESLKSNIICVMDTAIDRTRAELERCQPDKIVWFLAPTVTLCEQQYEVFKSYLPGYGILLLSGKDNVDHWTDQGAWDAVLLNIRIVVSTHQVLLDALTHAFVRMSRLALLVFDEAHHCTLKHPAHRIMSDFYMPWSQHDLPKILGLSASPVMKAKATSESLQQIEKNLCATTRTPKLHRSELMQYVHLPQLVRIDYPEEKPQGTKLLSSLQHAHRNYDIRHDPYVLRLLRQQRQGYDVSKQIQKIFTTGKTYCKDQLRSLVLKAEAVLEELGTSPMEWYLHQCMRGLGNITSPQLLDWSDGERKHLQKILTSLPRAQRSTMSLAHISRKVSLLIDLLTSESENKQNLTCLVFVEQRVWIACIAEILALHPKTKHLSVGTFVGDSQSSKRKGNIATLAEPRNQQTTLDDFRAGNLKVILATSVLEEGIDVSSCHLVICFEPPKNLKSFVQRRGRARKQESKYVIFVSKGKRCPQSWQVLEEEMKAAYLDDSRQINHAEEQEAQSDSGQKNFRVPGTGALLSLDNASQHLHHFCSILGSGPYVDTRPQFEFTEESGLITARVILPMSVDPKFRTACGTKSWTTERMAKQDAAFEAYKALYVAGLVNDNLLPARQEVDDAIAELQIPDHRPSLVPVSPLLDPWPLIARCQQEKPQVYHRVRLTLHMEDTVPIHLLLLTPTAMPDISGITLYWNKSETIKIESSKMQDMVLNNSDITALRSVTYKILHSVFKGRMAADRHDFIWLIAPCDDSGLLDYRIWLSNWRQETCLATDLIAQKIDWSLWGLVNQAGDARKYIPRAIRLDNRVWWLQSTRLPKRRDFLHPVHEPIDNNNAYTKMEEMAANDCVVDPVPAVYSMFALLMPSIIHTLSMGIVTETLRTTLLAPIGIESSHSALIATALKSSAADEHDNYQRLEFLGDCVLKFIASVHLMAANIRSPESFLTAKKGRIVSNGFLARASLAAGLERFMITKPFTGAKWAPRYAGDVLAETTTTTEAKEERSSKLVADVVESLIGASYAIGGLEKAFLCIKTLLPLERWTSVEEANAMLQAAAPERPPFAGLYTLEILLGYTFKNKALLLEALTHASFNGSVEECSYERLEFLGDAVLDYIVSRRLYAQDPPLSHQKMHAIRTATVNASFLAFRMFETTTDETVTNKANMQPETQKRAIWQFLRLGNAQVHANRHSAMRQHQLVREQIITGLSRDPRYPWHLFALTDPPKFLSDIVESIIGAVYVDSHGDISVCEAIIRRLGIIDCLEHILRNDVDCLHPKERLGHLALDKAVQYLRVNKAAELEVGGDKVHTCQIKVGGEDIGGVVGGVKRLNAETIAAWKAVDILESRKHVVIEDAGDKGEFFDAEDGHGVSLEY
ncbi:Dicer-like protein 2 [Pleosporales sp. CAS-2024a]